jgi:hypothetical protein
MALKPDREYNETTDITYFWSELAGQNTQEKGGCAAQESVSSGVAMDASGNVAQYADDGSGAVPLGVLLQDVNPPLSTTRDFLDHQSLEVRPGDKVTLLRKGWVVTDSVSGTTIAGGDVAYLGDSGIITNNQISSGHPVVGRFETSLDADGFARVFMDI